MSNPKHTPGPWTLRQESDRFIHIVEPNSDAGIAAVLTEHDEDGLAIDQANARLIAAAPELLEALKSVVKTHGLKTAGGTGQLSLGDIARFQDLITKATGGAE